MTLQNPREGQMEELGGIVTGHAALIGRRADLASDSKAVHSHHLAEKAYAVLVTAYNDVWDILHESDLHEEE